MADLQGVVKRIKSDENYSEDTPMLYQDPTSKTMILFTGSPDSEYSLFFACSGKHCDPASSGMVSFFESVQDLPTLSFKL